MKMRKPSPGSVVAVVALFFALGGSAIAAKHYLITSTKQIKPSVLKALKGKAGPQGKEGATGKEGKEGAAGKEGKEGKEGKQGEAGPFPTTLPSGKTLRGHYHIELNAKEAGDMGAGYTYAFPLASTPTTHFIADGTSPPAQCPGTFENPQAQPGNLCVYESTNHTNDQVVVGSESDRFGFGLLVVAESNTTGFFWSIGSWAVTAP